MATKTNMRNHDFHDAFHVRSEKLVELRAVIREWKDLNNIVGGAFQFRLVVDTNVILGDLIWLVSKRTDDTAKTSLMEVIDAETVQVFAPLELSTEVEEKIPIIAHQKGLNERNMVAQWNTYKKKITFSEADAIKVSELSSGVDPDDAPFVALADQIGAHGVISKDPHIAAMGGNKISVECVTSLRNYSRDTAIELNIKVNGVRFAMAGITVFRSAYSLIKTLLTGLKQSPDWLKILLLLSLLFVAFNPSARLAVTRKISGMLEGIGSATVSVISAIGSIAELAKTHQTAARQQLESAQKELLRSNETHLGGNASSN